MKGNTTAKRPLRGSAHAKIAADIAAIPRDEDTTVLCDDNRVGRHRVPLPLWGQVLDLASRAARVDTRARVIGWDIAVTPKGPVLIEGNHNWGKVLWQLPVTTGMAQELTRIKALVSTPEMAAAAS